MDNDIMSDPELRELFGGLLRDMYALRYKGEKIEFNLKPGQYQYRYFESPSGRRYCYTPHPSTKGSFFVWTYVPKGNGARSGSASRFSARDLVKCAKRKTAKSKALARYYKDKERSSSK